MGPFRQILVPIDFGDAMQPAIDLALALAKGTEAQVVLVHAFDTQAFYGTAPMGVALDIEPVLADLERELAAVRDKTRANWPRVDSVFRTGSVPEAILEVAHANRADLIVLGTHGRRGFARLLLGSVAEKVVRMSPVPVLTVRPNQAKAETASR